MIRARVIFLKTKKYTHAREKIINVLTNTPHTLQSAIVLCTKSHGVNYVRTRNIYIFCVFLIFLLPKNSFKREVLWRIKYARSVYNIRVVYIYKKIFGNITFYFSCKPLLLQ